MLGNMPTLLSFLRGASFALVTVVIWEVAALKGWISSTVLPAPYEVAASTLTIFSTRREVFSLVRTLIRVIEGVAFSACIGLPLGLLFSYYRDGLQYIGWAVDLIRAIPPAILLPLLFFASQMGGDNDWARMRLVCFGCVPILFLQLTESTRRLPSQRMEYIRTLKASPLFEVRTVLVYDVLPNAFIGLRTILSFGMVIVVVTEILYAPTFGVGARINEWQQDYKPQFVYAYALILGVIGICLNQLVAFAERRIVHWQT